MGPLQGELLPCVPTHLACILGGEPGTRLHEDQGVGGMGLCVSCKSTSAHHTPQISGLPCTGFRGAQPCSLSCWAPSCLISMFLQLFSGPWSLPIHPHSGPQLPVFPQSVCAPGIILLHVPGPCLGRKACPKPGTCVPLARLTCTSCPFPGPGPHPRLMAALLPIPQLPWLPSQPAMSCHCPAVLPEA